MSAFACFHSSVSLTDLTESVKSPKEMSMNVREKDTILSFNVLLLQPIKKLSLLSLELVDGLLSVDIALSGHIEPG